jgi:hypothetical protein
VVIYLFENVFFRTMNLVRPSPFVAFIRTTKMLILFYILNKLLLTSLGVLPVYDSIFSIIMCATSIFFPNYATPFRDPHKWVVVYCLKPLSTIFQLHRGASHWQSLSVTCGKSVIFSRYSGFSPPTKLTATI